MTSQAMPRRSPLLLAALWLSVLIAVGVVLRRLYAFADPNPAGPPQLVALDRAFGTHEALTLTHILPALAFVLLAPLVLLGRHAPWVRPALLVIGTVVGVTAYAMSSFAVGGLVEQMAVLLFNSLFLFWLWRAYLQGRLTEGGAVLRHNRL